MAGKSGIGVFAAGSERIVRSFASADAWIEAEGEDSCGILLLRWRQPGCTGGAALTPRERDILDAIAAGLGNKAIARQLALSPRTVEVHRANIMPRAGQSGPFRCMIALEPGQTLCEAPIKDMNGVPPCVGPHRRCRSSARVNPT